MFEGRAEGTGNQENNITAPAGMHNEDGGRDYTWINRQPGWDYFRDGFAGSVTYPSTLTVAFPKVYFEDNHNLFKQETFV